MISSSLRFRIYLGFALITLLLVLTGIVGLFGQSTLREQIAQSQKIGHVSSTVLKIDRDIQDMRLRVDRYVNSGHTSLQTEIQTIHQRVVQGIESVKKTITGNEDWQKELDRILLHVNSYSDQFNTVVVERRLRQELVTEQLPQLYSDALQKIAELSGDLNAKGSDSANRVHLDLCRTEMLQSEKSFLRYFESSNSENVTQAVAFLKAATNSASQLEGVDDHRKGITDALDQLTKVGLRAVQATRSYLFFRNVVMAGEQSEIAFYARRLRLSTEERQAKVVASTQAVSERANWTTVSITVAAIGLALFTAAQLAYLILPPLAQMKTTFGRLSAGESLSSIPGQERRDEIGELAHAASVFSDQNQRTRDLLEQSESLSDQLTQRADELAASNQELDQFAYIASHDLKSPLRGIRQLASWIEEDTKEQLPAKSVDHLQKMQARVSRMETLLDDLLEYSRVGRQTTSTHLVNSAELVNNMTDFLDNPDRIRVEGSENLPTFETLAAPFKQVLQNLIGNAIKYNDKGSSGLITIDCQREDLFFRFTISDNGPGIDECNHERVFQMFQRVGHNSVDGSGMGLAMVRKQIQAVGGTIRVESQPEQGSEFIFTWPTQVLQSPQQEAT